MPAELEGGFGLGRMGGMPHGGVQPIAGSSAAYWQSLTPLSRQSLMDAFRNPAADGTSYDIDQLWRWRNTPGGGGVLPQPSTPHPLDHVGLEHAAYDRLASFQSTDPQLPKLGPAMTNAGPPGPDGIMTPPGGSPRPAFQLQLIKPPRYSY